MGNEFIKREEELLAEEEARAAKAAENLGVDESEHKDDWQMLREEEEAKESQASSDDSGNQELAEAFQEKIDLAEYYTVMKDFLLAMGTFANAFKLRATLQKYDREAEANDGYVARNAGVMKTFAQYYGSSRAALDSTIDTHRTWLMSRFRALQSKCLAYGIEMLDVEEKDYLNQVYDPDRREYFHKLVNDNREKKILSPVEMEARWQALLEKRKKKAAKKS